MDVGIITGEMWEGIHRLVMVLWLIVPAALVLGASILLSAAIIPSLISTGELPPRAGKLRRPLNAIILVSALSLLAVSAFAVLDLRVIGEFWPRWLI